MPKTIQKDRRTQLKETILKLLSVNGRMSIGDIARRIKATKASAYNLFLETVNEYDLHFVPEINIEELWRYEFLKLSFHKSTKKEMREEILDKLPEMGFDQYIVFFKFLKKPPSDEKIIKAIGESYIPQYIARVRGHYDLVMHGVARSFEEMDNFLIDFRKVLGRCPLLLELNVIKLAIGFFPLRDAVIQQFNISDTYKDLLLGLNQDGRQEFKEIAKKAKKKPELIVYGMDRLKRTGILKRITYYQNKPKNIVNTIILMKIIDESLFSATRHKWILDAVLDYQGKPNEYILAGDISSTHGITIFGNFESNGRAEEFLNKLKKRLKGVEFQDITITKPLMGHLGVRNFDMRYSHYYTYLEMKKLMPRFKPEAEEEGELGVSAENPPLES